MRIHISPTTSNSDSAASSQTARNKPRRAEPLSMNTITFSDTRSLVNILHFSHFVPRTFLRRIEEVEGYLDIDGPQWLFLSQSQVTCASSISEFPSIGYLVTWIHREPDDCYAFRKDAIRSRTKLSFIDIIVQASRGY